MTHRAIPTPTRSAANRLLALLDKLDGLPRRGVRLTPGRTPISDTPGVGWTIRATGLVQHPTSTDQHAVLLPDDVLAMTQDSDRRRRLTDSERTELDGDVATAIDLGDDWKETSSEGDLVFRRVELDA